jgi:hypothetical protein
MGKSLGVNSKAQEGRERKAAQKELKSREQERKKEEQEARQWESGAKAAGAKQIREEQKKQEKALKKLERERLEAIEAAELAKYKPLNPSLKEKTKEAVKLATDTSTTSLPKFSPSLLSTTSTQSSCSSSAAPEGVHEYSASNIDDALFLLDPSSSTSVNKTGVLERHPERRMRATFLAFEEREMPRLKEEFPGLRLSQLREKLQRRWQKSPDNPMNQTHLAFNATKSQEVLKTSTEVEANLARLRINPQ